MRTFSNLLLLSETREEKARRISCSRAVCV